MCTHKTVSNNTFHFKFIYIYKWIYIKLLFIYLFFMKEFIIFPLRLLPGVYGLSPSLFPSVRYDWISVRQEFFKVPRSCVLFFIRAIYFVWICIPGIPLFENLYFFQIFSFLDFLLILPSASMYTFYCKYFTSNRIFHLFFLFFNQPQKKKKNQRGLLLQTSHVKKRRRNKIH